MNKSIKIKIFKDTVTNEKFYLVVNTVNTMHHEIGDLITKEQIMDLEILGIEYDITGINNIGT